MTDFDIKEIADADNSNIGYITTSGAIPEEQQKQQMREVELDASKDNRLRWGSLNPRKKINKTVL